MQDVRVAAAQMFGLPCRPGKNLDRMEALISKARRLRVKMICFPEMAISGFDYGEKLRPIYEASEFVPEGPSTQRLAAMGRKYKMFILAGISEKGEGELRFNTCVIVGPDGYVGKYRKVHMNSERWLYCEASDFPVFNSEYGCFGTSICYDNTFTESARILALQGAEILFSPHCFGNFPATKFARRSPGKTIRQWRIKHPLKFMQARASDNNMYAIFSNMVGGPHRYIGATFILNPMGDMIAQCDAWKEDLAVANLKASELIAARAAQTCTLKRRRASIYSELVRRA